MATVHFRFEDKTIDPKTITEVASGLSVLEIAEENGIHLNHNCGAVCACSTCHVYIDEGMESLPEITDREEDFIDRAINPTIDSRLGCQCIIEEDGVEISVTIPDQSAIIGHEH